MVAEVRASDPLETRRESEATRAALSVAGTEVANVLPSKIMVGLSIGEAEAEVGIALRVEIAMKLVMRIEIALCDPDLAIRLLTPDI